MKDHIEQNEFLDFVTDDWRKRKVWAEPLTEQVRILKASIDDVQFGELAVVGLAKYARQHPPIIVIPPSRPGKPLTLLDIAKAKRIAKAKVQARHATLVKKAVAFDHIVSQMDDMLVYGKPLSDCTKSDLLKAASQSDVAANKSTFNGVFYRQLAGILENGETVRESNHRNEIVALLSHTYPKEDA